MKKGIIVIIVIVAAISLMSFTKIGKKIIGEGGATKKLSAEEQALRNSQVKIAYDADNATLHRASDAMLAAYGHLPGGAGATVVPALKKSFDKLFSQLTLSKYTDYFKSKPEETPHPLFPSDFQFTTTGGSTGGGFSVGALLNMVSNPTGAVTDIASHVISGVTGG